MSSPGVRGGSPGGGKRKPRSRAEMKLQAQVDRMAFIKRATGRDGRPLLEDDRLTKQVVELVMMGGGDDTMMQRAQNSLGEYYASRQEWKMDNLEEAEVPPNVRVKAFPRDRLDPDDKAVFALCPRAP